MMVEIEYICDILMVQFSILTLPAKKIDSPYKVACKCLGTFGYIGYFSEPLNEYELAQSLYSTNTTSFLQT